LCLRHPHRVLHELPLHLRKTNLERVLARRPEGIFVNPFERGEIGPDLFRAACDMGLEGLVSKHGGAAGRSTGLRSRTGGIQR
jgi:ATP-dependent DNA ligase